MRTHLDFADKKELKSNKKRILLMHPCYAKYRKVLFEKLCQRFNMTFYFSFEPSKLIKGKQSKILTFAPRSKIRKQNKYLFPIIEVVDIILFLMKDNYAVTILEGLTIPTFVSIFLSKIKRNKCVLWVEDWFMPTRESITHKFRFSIIFWLYKFVLRSVDAIVVEGTPQYNFVRNFHISDEKIFYSNHCSLDYSEYESKNLKKALKIDKSLVVLYLGRINEAKGVDVLIRAFSKIEQERNDVFLLICGDGEFRYFCEGLAERLKTKRIMFLGKVEEEEKVASFYETADIFVIPSCARAYRGVWQRAIAVRPCIEGWGLVTNEAMSMGKPIIATDTVGAAQDLVKNGINGYVVKNGNVDELYLALKKILDNTELRKAMEKNSRRIFEEFNDFDAQFEGFKEAIEYCLKDS
jgi:glycosyltransferase involved in cell wall biosynthesis